MLYNFLIIAFRNLWRNKVFSVINIVGLALGMAFSMSIGIYIAGEMLKNRDLKDIDRLFVVEGKWNNDNEAPFFTPTMATYLLHQNYPHLVKSYCRMGEIMANFSKGNIHILDDILLVDSTFLNMYGFKVLYGKPGAMFSQPYSIVITKKYALKYFGKVNAVNETLLLESQKEGIKSYRITGVLDDMTRNSVTQVVGANWNIFFPMEYAEAINRSGANEWWNSHMVHIKLNDGIKPEQINEAYAEVIQKHAPDWIKSKGIIHVKSLKTYHLSFNNNELGWLLITLSGVLFFILIISLINFVNITVGLSSGRLKEIGVRKVFGSSKNKLAIQFFLETILIAAISGLIALLIYECSHGYAGQVFGETLPSVIHMDGNLQLLILGFIILVGVVAGLYPAVVLSSVHVIDAVHSRFEFSIKGRFLKMGLIILQLTVTIAISIITVVISLQTNYFFQKKLGFDRENIVVVMGAPRMFYLEGVQKMETARQQFSELNQVQSVSFSWTHPAWNTWNENFIPPGQDEKNAILMAQLSTDEYYADVFGLRLLAGVYFRDEKHVYKEHSLVLNALAVKALGWNNTEAIGKKLKKPGSDQLYEVVGVVEDYHIGSLKYPIVPLSIVHVREVPHYRFFTFKIKPDQRNALSDIEKKWRLLFPDAPFDHTTMDEHIARQYATELKLKKASNIAGGLALCMSVMGLIGMISLTVVRRSKEIAVRKILGSSVVAVIRLFVEEFFWYLLFATIIGVLAAYCFANWWLLQFAYKVDISPLVFLLVCMSVAAIILGVISIQTLKTAMSNPVKSLRSE